jgi:hypothetical protein
MRAIHRYAGLAAFAVAVSAPLAASAQPSLVATFANPAYAVATACVTGQPLADVYVVLRNAGDATTPAVQLTASDTTDTLVADVANVSPVPPGAQITVAMHLRFHAGGTGVVGGPHAVGVAAGSAHVGPLTVTLPANFCGPATQRISARPAAAIAVLSTPSPSPLLHQTTTVQATRTSPFGQSATEHSNIGALIKLGVPANVRSVQSGPDCGAHVGPLGALVCPDMIKSGDLLLVWDWLPGSGPDDIDGYRVYRLDGGARQLVTTQSNKKALTLADLPKTAAGYAGHCYGVVAYHGTLESDLSPSFCANGSAAARTARLAASHIRGSQQTRNKAAYGFAGWHFVAAIAQSAPVQVGFNYSTNVSTFVDGFSNEIHRSGIAFDVTPYANHNIVSAKLHLTLAESVGSGNNHSCTTAVGTGVEFWWQNDAWLQGSFTVAPTETGPDVTADVTQLVAPWLRGEPNYGFLLKNDDENLGAFTNKTCRSAYSNPVLELTYY